MVNLTQVRIFTGLVGFSLLAACVDKGQSDAEESSVQHSEDAHEKHGAEGPDSRSPLNLSPEENFHVRAEMHGLLTATQGVIAGLVDDDMAKVQAAAAPAGLHAPGTVELRLAKKLPEPFRKLGKNIHVAFDEIGAMAADGKPPKEIQLYLAQAMNGCSSCHETYRLGEEE